MAASRSRIGRAARIAAFTLGVAGVLTGCSLLLKHIDAFGPKRDMAVLIGSALPDLRSRVALLGANVEAEQLFGMEKHAAREEQASAYILPEQPEGSRAVSVLQETAAALTADGSPISIGGISFARESVTVDDHRELAATVKVSASPGDVARLLTALEFSGDLSVRDALPPDRARAFLELVEKESPLSLPSAEEFLFSDLVTYAAEPDKAEQRLTRDMQPSAAADVRTLLLSSGLADVRASLSAVAPRLKAQRLWPMPLMRVDAIERDGDGEWTLVVTVFGRA